MPPKGKKKGKKKGKQSGPAKQEPGVPTDREELLQKEYVCRCNACPKTKTKCKSMLCVLSR